MTEKQPLKTSFLIKDPPDSLGKKSARGGGGWKQTHIYILFILKYKV